MKKVWSLCFIFCTVYSQAQNPGEWVWIHGSNVPNSNGYYGIQGIPSPSNEPPAAYEPCEWTDHDGNFWLFGGANGADVFDDLWKYDPLTNEWTWMKGSGLPGDTGNFGIQGVASPSNNPPGLAFGITTWVDDQGDLWLFGGVSFSMPQYHEALWKYSISTNEWTWMKGNNFPTNYSHYGIRGVSDPANYPKNLRECAASWTDSMGKLWLFPNANVLWRYDIALNEWTWMKGDSIGSGRFGIKGIEDSLNFPYPRYALTRWVDHAGNFWLFSGIGNLANDLWRFNQATQNWTWMNGDSVAALPDYGTRCVPLPGNHPGGTYETRATWVDPDGNLWLFGGAITSPNEQRNDLWKYCIDLNQWIWISGANYDNDPGNWGTLGVSSPLNRPCRRQGSVGWTDGNGHLYLFGGEHAYTDVYNDLWKFTIDTTCGKCQSFPTALFSSSPELCPGSCTDFTNLSSNASSNYWSFPGASPDTSTATNPTNICYTNAGSYDVLLIATNANGSDTLLLTNYITVFPAPPPQAIAQSGDTLFANAGGAAYQWYFNGNLIPGATVYFYVASSSGDYNVVATDAHGCEVEAAIFNVIAAIETAVIGHSSLVIYPNPVGNYLIFNIEDVIFKTAPQRVLQTEEIHIYNMLGKIVMSGLPEAGSQKREATIDVRELPSGMYILELSANEKTLRTKFVKE